MHCGFDLHFPDFEHLFMYLEHLFMCLLAIRMLYLEENVFSVPLPIFKLDCGVFIGGGQLLRFVNSLNIILDINLLSDI